MKIQAAYRPNGQIVTALALTDEKSGPALRIAVMAEVEVAEFDVPTEFAKKNVNEFLHLLRVDKATKQLVKR